MPANYGLRRCEHTRKLRYRTPTERRGRDLRNAMATNEIGKGAKRIPIRRTIASTERLGMSQVRRCEVRLWSNGCENEGLLPISRNAIPNSSNESANAAAMTM